MKYMVSKLIKNGEDFEAKYITWDIYNVSKGAKYTIVGETGFVPLSEGTFSIGYYAEDIAGKVSHPARDGSGDLCAWNHYHVRYEGRF